MKTWTKWMGAAAVVLTLPACVLPLGVLDEDVHVHGSGRLVTEARTVPPFDGVAASGALHVVVVQSGRPGVRVTAEDNLGCSAWASGTEWASRPAGRCGWRWRPRRWPRSTPRAP